MADEVSDAAALPAAEVAEETLLVADEATLEAPEAKLEAADEAEDSREEIADPALDEIAEAEEAASEEMLVMAPIPEMVVDPTVVSKVEESLVTVETIAEVVMADDTPLSVGLGVL
jgi:hypothetical protein